jgi:hypothetical protein
MTEYLHTHRRIKNEIEEQMKNETRVCVNVNSLADKLGMDARTVKIHLDIMKIDDCGIYLDDKKTVFCPVVGVKRLNNQFEKAIKKM